MIQKYVYYELSVKDSLFIWLFMIEEKKAHMRVKIEFVFIHICTQISVIYVYIHGGSYLHIYMCSCIYMYTVLPLHIQAYIHLLNLKVHSRLFEVLYTMSSLLGKVSC